MDNLDSAKRKMRDLFNRKDDNSTLIEKKTNDVSNVPLDLPYFKRLRPLEDTGDILRNPDYVSITNVEQNELMPVNFSWWYENTFTLPAKMIPFIDWQFGFSAPVDKPFVAFSEVDTDDWDSPFYRVQGDGSQIWEGILPPSAYPEYVGRASYSSFVTTQERIDDGSVLEHHTRPAWKVTMEWTSGGSQYRIYSACLAGFTSKKYNTSSSPCGGNTDGYYMIGSMWYDSHMAYPPGNFVDVEPDGTSFDVMGRRIHEWWTVGAGDPPSCDYNTDYTDGITKTFSRSDLSTIVVYGFRQKKVGGYWRYDPYGSGYGYGAYHTVTAADITSMTVVQEGFYVYYDNTRRWLFAMSYNYSTTPATPTLQNLPVINAYTALPYAHIDFYVNPDDHPRKVSERVGYKQKVFTVPYVQDGPKAPVWIRMSKSTDKKEKWMVRFSFAALRMVEASERSELTFLDWHDTYDRIDEGFYQGTYQLGDSDHDTKTRDRWSPPQEPVNLRVIGMARSPFYYKKTNKFNTGTT